MYRKAQKEERTFDPAEFGFVFSIAEIERWWTIRKAKMGLEAMKPSSFRRPKAA
jgi:hypothetical protein